MVEQTVMTEREGAQMVGRVGEGLWQGLRYCVAALAAAVAFAGPPLLVLLFGFGLLVLRLWLGVLYGAYATVPELVAGLLVIPVILAAGLLAAIVITLLTALAVSGMILTPAALVGHLIGGRARRGGLATALLLLLAGMAAGLIAAVIWQRLAGWLWPGPGFGLASSLRLYLFGLIVGTLAALVYVLALLVLSTARQAAVDLARWANEARPPERVSPVVIAPPTVVGAGSGSI